MDISNHVGKRGRIKHTSVNGLLLPKMTLGTVQLGMRYGVANQTGQPLLHAAFGLLQAAREGGVNAFDTARVYGESEAVLGKYFASNGLEDTIVVTKFRIDANSGVSPVEVERQVVCSVETSLEQLGLESLHFLLAHNPDDLVQYGGAVNRALKSLQHRGLVGHTGASVYTAQQVDAILAQPWHTAIQIPINALDTRLVRGGHLGRLQAAGFIVFVRSVFLQGLLFLKKFPPDLAVASPFVQKLHRLSEAANREVADLALSYVRDLPGVTSLVLGAETSEQVRKNIHLMDAPPLEDNLRENIGWLAANTPIEEIMQALLAR